jgi:hypothetical protein
VFGPEGLDGQATGRAGLREVIECPPGAHESEEGLSESQHAFDRAMGEIVRGEEGVESGPGPRPIGAHTGQ